MADWKRYDIPNWLLWMAGISVSTITIMAAAWADNVNQRFTATEQHIEKVERKVDEAASGATTARERLATVDEQIKNANRKLDDISEDVKMLVRQKYSVGNQ